MPKFIVYGDYKTNFVERDDYKILGYYETKTPEEAFELFKKENEEFIEQEAFEDEIKIIEVLRPTIHFYLK
ncbi:MAG: hypothetical protein QMC85_03900 [Methanocellales archaeon]|nr:hypothetical protein [Methanocellales archaeon]MDI6903354.1 hypothetical protein [Methanocellales archaeon]